MGAQHWLVAAGLFGLVACGGAEFQRTAGAPTFAALPPAHDVAIVASDSELPPPVVEVGTLRYEDSSGDEAEVRTTLQRLARRKGCDAVVGLTSTLDEQRKVVTENGLDATGKPATVQKEKVKRRWHWQGRCVRSASVDVPRTATATSP